MYFFLRTHQVIVMPLPYVFTHSVIRSVRGQGRYLMGAGVEVRLADMGTLQLELRHLAHRTHNATYAHFAERHHSSPPH